MGNPVICATTVRTVADDDDARNIFAAIRTSHGPRSTGGTRRQQLLEHSLAHPTR
jgi:ABC-type Fe3+-citrate transport system substrate-binding protein